MMNYDNEYKKHITIQSFKKYVLDYFNDHYIYFMTYTFKNTFKNSKNLSSYDALISLKQKLDQAAVSRSSTRSKKTRLLCIPEKSHDCKVSTMRKEDHYHCFLMLPKNYQERFFKKAVKDRSNVYYDVLDKDVPKLDFYSAIYNSQRASKKDDSVYEELNPKMSLQPYDLDVRCLQELSDVARAYDYATKNVCNMKVDFTYDDLKEFEASSAKNRHYKQHYQDDKEFLLF